MREATWQAMAMAIAEIASRVLNLTAIFSVCGGPAPLISRLRGAASG
jgi:hypothetical protein